MIVKGMRWLYKRHIHMVMDGVALPVFVLGMQATAFVGCFGYIIPLVPSGWDVFSSSALFNVFLIRMALLQARIVALSLSCDMLPSCEYRANPARPNSFLSREYWPTLSLNITHSFVSSPPMIDQPSRWRVSSKVVVFTQSHMDFSMIQGAEHKHLRYINPYVI